ncbi:MAG: response regulator [Candidatus Schekmanbacteria bacterium]|nr:response regulator [Candidatus Schekmanbacteria bacterium]
MLTLNNLAFRHKLRLVSALVAAAFAAVLAVYLYVNAYNSRLLSPVENGYAPALVMTRDLEAILDRVHLNIRDARSGSDEIFLDEAQEAVKEFHELLDKLAVNSVVPARQVSERREELERYYQHARTAAMEYIDLGKNTPKVMQDLEQTQSNYAALRTKLQGDTARSRELMSHSLRELEKSNRISLVILSVIIVGALVFVMVLTHMLNRSLTRTIADAVNVAGKFGEGSREVRMRVRGSDEMGRLARAFNSMMAEIQEAIERNERDSWLKTGQTEIGAVLRGERPQAELAAAIVRYLATYLGAQVGALYVAGETELRLVGSYAFSHRKSAQTTIAFGEGVAGQAALERTTIVLTEVPEGYLQVRSALGDAPPRHIAVVPLIYNDLLIGVVEIAAFRPFSELMLAFLESVAESVAVSLHSASSRIKMQQLLEKTQQQSEELQAQQEELRQTNEELEEQTRSLIASQEELKRGRRQLERANSDLEVKTQTLERQRDDIRRSNEELEQIRRLLEQKARELEAASRYKSEFLANMSHELRTPLNSLLILARILADNPEKNLTAKQVQYARTIHAGGTELLELINDVLDLSKIEAGRMTVTVEPVETAAIASYIEENFRHIADNQGLYLRVSVGEGAVTSIDSDRQKVEQIVKNLLANAFKFTSQGGVEVRIETPPESGGRAARNESTGSGGNGAPARDCPAPRGLLIRVADSGVGIPKDKQNLIFEAFQQADGSTQRRFGGTGLGLSISMQLARLLGGRIDLESEVGSGSVFSLLIPDYAQRQAAAIAAGASTAPDGAAVAPATRPAELAALSAPHLAAETPAYDAARRVLVVDDDAACRNLLVEKIGDSEDVGVTAVATGREALGLLRQERFNGIVIDLGLDDMSGFELLEKLQGDDELARIPKIVYTGRALSRDEERRLRQVANSIVIKGERSMERLSDEISLWVSDSTRGGRGQSEAEKPAAAAAVAPAPPPSAVLKARPGGGGDARPEVPRGRTILLVDDDMRNLFALSAVIEGKELRVLTAENGREALERLAEHPEVDLVLMDIMMPEMDGYEAMHQIRAQGRFARLPIIALTAKAMKGDRAKCIEAGANDYLSKPVDTDRLLSLIRVWLN